MDKIWSEWHDYVSQAIMNSSQGATVQSVVTVLMIANTTVKVAV